MRSAYKEQNLSPPHPRSCTTLESSTSSPVRQKSQNHQPLPPQPGLAAPFLNRPPRFSTVGFTIIYSPSLFNTQDVNFDSNQRELWSDSSPLDRQLLSYWRQNPMYLSSNLFFIVPRKPPPFFSLDQPPFSLLVLSFTIYDVVHRPSLQNPPSLSSSSFPFLNVVPTTA